VARVAATLCQRIAADSHATKPSNQEAMSGDSKPEDTKLHRAQLLVVESGGDGQLEFALKRSQDTVEDKQKHFVCLLYTNYLVVVLMRIRTMIASASGIFVLFALAVMSYPFEPKGLIQSILLVMFGALVVAVTIVYAQMHRDETLSRITETKVGALGSAFWGRMAGFIALPLISVLAAQFPSIGNFLFSWVEPAVQAVR
jgi:hypothetical protein